MSDAYMQYETDAAVYRWHGGEYIEIGFFADDCADEDCATFIACDVIHVWDYEAGAPRIDVTMFQFAMACNEHEAQQS